MLNEAISNLFFLQISESAKLTNEASFSTDLGLDSLDVVEVVLAIEEEFNIEIPEYVFPLTVYKKLTTNKFDSHEADEIKTIGHAVEYILKQPDGK